MTIPGYDFARADFAELLLRSFYPEKTNRESGVIRDYLQQHLAEFDRVSFSVRVGEGLPPDPSHLVQIQNNTTRFTKKRIDVLGWNGTQPTIVEAKERLTGAALGQLLQYRHLFLEENPSAHEPRLVAIGRYSDEDTLRVFAANGVDVYLYQTAPTQ